MARKMVKALTSAVNKVHPNDPDLDSMKTNIPIEIIRHLKLEDKDEILWEYTEVRGRVVVTKHRGSPKS